MKEFEQAYREHVSTVFRFALRCVGRSDIAEEITSEAFLALLQNRQTVDLAQLPAWLLTVAKNRAIDYWRHAALEQRYVEAQLKANDPPSPSSPFEMWLFESKALKPIHRVCLILRYVHGMDRTEIAAHTGLTATQVKGHLQYARQLLRKELGKEMT